MKIYLLVLFACICFYHSIAQKPEIKWGAVIAQDDEKNDFKLLGSDDSSIYIFKFEYVKEKKSSIPFLVTLDKSTLKLRTDFPIPIPPLKSGNARLENVFFVKDKFVVFISIKKAKDEMDAAYAFVLNKDGSMGSKLKLVGEIKAVTKKIGDIPVNFFKFLISPDSSKFAVSIINSDLPEYSVTAFDGQLNTIWSDKINMAINGEKNFTQGALAIDNGLNLFICGKISKNNFSKTDYKFWVYDYRKKQLKDFPITCEKKSDLISTSGKFFNDKQGRTCYVALYGDNPDSYSGSSDLDGIILVKFNSDKIDKVFRSFSKVVRSGYMSQSKAEKGKPIDMLSINDLILNDDQSYQIVASRNWIHSKQSTIYNSEGIAVIKYDNTDNELWSVIVPNNQEEYEKNEPYMYSTVLNKNGELYFLFNDHKSNISILNQNDTKIMVKLEDATPVIVQVDKNGKIKKDAIFSNKDADTYLMPNKCIQSGNNEMLLFAKKKNNIQFGRLVLN